MKPPPTPRQHRHTCAECGHPWECMQLLDKAEEKKRTCPVDDAARVNNQGPFCGLCRTLSEARAFAKLRGITLVVQRLIS